MVFGLPIPTSVGGVIGLLIDVIIVFIVIVILDEIIAHEIEVKHSFIMAFLAYFIVPIALMFLPAIPLGGYIIPLIVWVALGEILLKADAVKRAAVAVAAFVVYMILTYVGIPMWIAGAIGF